MQHDLDHNDFVKFETSVSLLAFLWRISYEELRHTLLIIVCFHFCRVLGESSDFYLYRISYLWYSPLGFAITVIFGLVISNIFRILTTEVPRQLNSDLFTPMVANRIRNRLDPMTKTGCQNETFDLQTLDTVQ